MNSTKRSSRICALATLASAVLVTSTVRGDTLAYWRFDDRAEGDKLEAELGTEKPPFTTIGDASKHGNDLRTFNTRSNLFPPDTSGRIMQPRGLPGLAGQISNERCARFTGEQDFYTFEAADTVPPINSVVLDRFTVEGIFKLDTLSRRWDDRAQVIVGKNGQPGKRLPYQPFVVVVTGREGEQTSRDCLSVNIIDKGGTYRVAASRKPLAANQWYAFAAVCDGSRLQLFINRFDGAGYQLEGESAVEFGLIRSADSWAVGRGAYDKRPNSWLQGWADEIRISDEVLAPERWITSGITSLPPNEPATASTTQPTTQPSPIIRDLADPEVIRHNGTYYAYGTASASDFDAWASNDLKNWTKTPKVIGKGPGVWGESHFWAPGAIERDGKFYLLYSADGVMPDTGGRHSVRMNIAIANAPTGPFKEVAPRVPLLGRAVIDPQVFIDRDGKPYLYFVADISENNGSGQIYVVRLSDDLLTPVGEPVPCIQPSQAWEGTTWNEGPFVFREGDTYVMMYSGSFWASHSYAVGVATSPSPTGPWKKRDDNPFLLRFAGLFGTGHNSIVRSPDDKDWLIFFHAHRNERVTRRDTYVAKLVVDRDARGDVRLSAVPWQPEPK